MGAVMFKKNVGRTKASHAHVGAVSIPGKLNANKSAPLIKKSRKKPVAEEEREGITNTSSTHLPYGRN